ncbi:MAG: hypothetical protein H7Y38_02840 [Armatimonadetes bacterium]|nr:hypothetical protein [Armatimonadota bacterium]
MMRYRVSPSPTHATSFSTMNAVSSRSSGGRARSRSYSGAATFGGGQGKHFAGGVVQEGIINAT